MATEIFIEPELQELETETAAAEWFEIATELGLQHQIAYTDKSEEKKAPPYMYVDPKTQRIIRTLCPCVVSYKDYKASTIPLDVLQEIAKCVQNGWYKEIKICYDNKSPDPFVVGFTHSKHSWEADKHLIARWGAELLPFEVLEQKAIDRLRDDAIEALTEIKLKIETGLANADQFIKTMLGGKDKPALNFDVRDLQW